MTKLSETSDSLLFQPLTLPCGAVLKNRIVKSAMSDGLGDGEGNSTEWQASLYEKWALGGVGLALIGEVQVLPDAPESAANLLFHQEANLAKLQQLSQSASQHKMHLWPQLGHAGCLATSSVTRISKGPSALSLEQFQCDALTTSEIQALPDQYANAARIAQQVGFGGVQIHAGHGFLLSQFLSPLFNRRQDEYGGDIQHRLSLILQIIDQVRQVVGSNFPIGIKINSSDQLTGGLSQEDSLAAIRLLDSSSLDLIEISGGSYFPGASSSSDKVSTGPYFVDFAKQAKQLTRIPIVVTGGFKTRQQALYTLATKSADAIGLARALALNPALAKDWASNVLATDPSFPRFSAPPTGGITAWYTQRLRDLAEAQNPIPYNSDQVINLDQAIQWLEHNETEKAQRWRQKFQLDC